MRASPCARLEVYKVIVRCFARPTMVPLGALMSREKSVQQPAKEGTPKDAGPIDRLVGRRIAMRRRELGKSQAALADQLGISFQQLQKYEGGENRITVARLAHIAAELDVDVTYFLVGAVSIASLSTQEGLERWSAIEFDVHDLLSAFLRIEEDDVRLMIVNLTRAAADGKAPDRALD